MSEGGFPPEVPQFYGRTGSGCQAGCSWPTETSVLLMNIFPMPLHDQHLQLSNMEAVYFESLTGLSLSLSLSLALSLSLSRSLYLYLSLSLSLSFSLSLSLSLS